MVPPTDSPEAASGTSFIPAEWSAQAADAVVDVVAKVRDKTTRPALVGVRALVYGIVIGVTAVSALVLTIILLLRMYDNWVPGPYWIAYAALGVVLMVGGVVLLLRAGRAAPPV